MMRSRILPIAALVAASLAPTLEAQRRQDFKVDVHWNRLHDYDELVEIMASLQQAWPRHVSMSSIGKSYEGREMWILTVQNPDTGPAADKPAFWLDANVHGNEVQGGDAALYRAFLASCLQQFPDDLRQGDAAVAAADAPALRRVAHSLKSVLLLLGEAEASDAARRLEHAAEAADWGACHGPWYALAATLRRMIGDTPAA